MDLQAWMDRGRAMDCTDLHLTVGLPVVARMLGELTILGDEPSTKEDIHSMLAKMCIRDSFYDNRDIMILFNTKGI